MIYVIISFEDIDHFQRPSSSIVVPQQRQTLLQQQHMINVPLISAAIPTPPVLRQPPPSLNNVSYPEYVSAQTHSRASVRSQKEDIVNMANIECVF